jgi:hypothetical protein
VTAPYVPPRHDWRAKLRETFTERLGLKVIALLLAVLLWLVVEARRPADGDVTVGAAPLLDPPRRTPLPSERPVAPQPASDSTVAATR